jgi:hypothetical protein
MAFCMTVLAGVIQATGYAAQAARLFRAAKKLLQSLNAAIDPRAAHSNTTATSPTRALDWGRKPSRTHGNKEGC